MIRAAGEHSLHVAGVHPPPLTASVVRGSAVGGGVGVALALGSVASVGILTFLA